MWEGSQLEIVISALSAENGNFSSWQEIHRSSLLGTHNATTSINYIEAVKLPALALNITALKATYTIIGGQRFQINGMAFCNTPN
jgi:hypothetical protein